MSNLKVYMPNLTFSSLHCYESVIRVLASVSLKSFEVNNKSEVI